MHTYTVQSRSHSHKYQSGEPETETRVVSSAYVISMSDWNEIVNETFLSHDIDVIERGTGECTLRTNGSDAQSFSWESYPSECSRELSCASVSELKYWTSPRRERPSQVEQNRLKMLASKVIVVSGG